jgi:hypothetical protein
MKMNRTELKDLLVAAAKNKGIANFSASDVQSAASNALLEHFGFKDASMRDIRSQKEAVFAVIEEVIDEVVPMMVQDRTGDFAEVQTFPRNSAIMYKIPMAEESRRRMYRALKPGARGGIYKAFRLDGFTLTVTPEVHTIGYAITLEELLTGQRTVQELVTVITDAWMEKIYQRVFEALSTAANQAPAANQVAAGVGTEVVNEYMDRLISITRAYGNPVILGFPAQLRLLQNVPGAITAYANPADLDDIRRQGYIGLYKGVPLVELPNYIISHPASGAIDWLFDETKLFIVPAGVRPVKVAFQGESHLEEVKQPHGGFEYHNHRIFAVTVLFKNHICSYESLTDVLGTWTGGSDGNS